MEYAIVNATTIHQRNMNSSMGNTRRYKKRIESLMNIIVALYKTAAITHICKNAGEYSVIRTSHKCFPIPQLMEYWNMDNVASQRIRATSMRSGARIRN